VDESTKNQLIKASDLLIDADNWASVELLWKPYLDQGDLEARAQLACLYVNNGFDEGEEKNHQMESLLRETAEVGQPDAMYWFAFNVLRDGIEHDEMVKRAAERGCIEAQRNLGVCYATGDWTGPTDQALAVQWYRRAAERGHDDAQYDLGFMIILGEGTRADATEGLRWLHLSAEQGNIDAMRLLADLYEHGSYGAPQDATKAAQWQRRYDEAYAVLENQAQEMQKRIRENESEGK